MGEMQNSVQAVAPSKGPSIVAIILGALSCNPIALGLGIAGVVLIGQFATKLALGDQTSAVSSANLGKSLGLAGMIVGIVFLLISIIILIAYFVIVIAAGGLEAFF